MSTALHPDLAAEPGARFPRTARLLKPSEFSKVFRSNQASTDALFRVLWRVNDGADDRLGMAVSRKVDRRAVGRNRIKRVIRERFRRWRTAQPGGDRHFDVVVLARPRAAQAANADLVRSLERHWRRIAGIRDEAERTSRAKRKLN